MAFEQLVASIRDVHASLSAQASKAVNISLTMRNWLIGCYIAEYELHGADRAEYGDALLSHLASGLTKLGVSACARGQLYLYLRFYRAYPAIVRSLTEQLQHLVPESITPDKGKVRPPTVLSRLDPTDIVQKLSYTHIEQLVAIDDETKRAFYEFECIRGNWSVRELKRQIASLYCERSGLSLDKKKLSELAHAGAEQSEAKLSIRDPYIFEFLGIKPSEVMAESALEDALTNKLQAFLLELGHGFCFEARQKRILIGDTYGFVDLVFYHRVLKCHVLIDLKLEDFSHENIGQLNTYVSWYRKHMMAEGDNPPIGILLCTQKNHALVEYALAGIDNQLFVSKYQLALPTRDDMQHFLEREIAESDLPEDDSTTGRLVREMREAYGARIVNQP
ncbi:MAG: DUF1016 family protein [Verrucomicrobia bacterium]|nr:DUF1016 family protein [Verrucomicrobiota bacterium]MBT7067766.1 DUF1016 family protein [Verrucomicrobiota bacterium]MBT7699199.1 DUF1016 family protein [Verrucomicrobiota bacterium]